MARLNTELLSVMMDTERYLLSLSNDIVDTIQMGQVMQQCTRLRPRAQPEVDKVKRMILRFDFVARSRIKNGTSALQNQDSRMPWVAACTKRYILPSDQQDADAYMVCLHKYFAF